MDQKQQIVYFEDHAVECRWIIRKKENHISLSVFLVNRYKNDGKDIPIDHILFQPKIIIEGEDEDSYPFIEEKLKVIMYWMILILIDLDYCIVIKQILGWGIVVQLNGWTMTRKKREHSRQRLFPQSGPLPAVEHLELKGLSGLDMFVLAYIEDQQQLREQLMPVHKEFDKWINEQKEIVLKHNFEEQRKKHIEICNEAADRIQEGIELVCTDPQAFDAFRFANEMMLYQRSFSMET